MGIEPTTLIRNQMRYPVAPRAQNTLYISTVCYNFEVMNMNVDKIKMIVCDIDNTLIPSGSEQLSERNRNALQTALANGFDVMINTGRHYTFLQPTLLRICLWISLVRSMVPAW